MLNPFRPQSVPSAANADFARFMGFFTAHTIWQLEGGENVIPLLAYESSKGKKSVERVEGEDYAEAATQARTRFASHKTKVRFGLFAVDGYVTPSGGRKREAIIAEGYDAATQAAPRVVVTYSRSKDTHKLVIDEPQFDRINGDEGVFVRAFWEGVEAHVEAAAFWHRHLGQ